MCAYEWFVSFRQQQFEHYVTKAPTVKGKREQRCQSRGAAKKSNVQNRGINELRFSVAAALVYLPRSVSRCLTNHRPSVNENFTIRWTRAISPAAAVSLYC